MSAKNRQSVRELVQRIREDRIANGNYMPGGPWWMPGWHAMVVYRFGRWLLTVDKVTRFLLRPFYTLAFVFIRNVYGIEISWRTTIGRRFICGHQSGIVIHPEAVIGDDCMIRHNVTIGAISVARWWEAPKIGNRVEIGAGAMIMGPVTIGDDARIGPNTVVMTNVPAGAMVVAPPSRVIPPAKPKEPKVRNEQAAELQQA